MKRVVLLTGHFPFQKRRSSLLWVSDHLQSMGWHVTHATVGYSWLSWVKGDARIKALNTPPKAGHLHPKSTLSTLFGYAPFHPVNLRHASLNSLSQCAWPLFTQYWSARLRTSLAQADLVICESGPPVLLAPILKRHASQVPRIYRVNDNIALLEAPDGLIIAEKQLAPQFTRISTASPLLANHFRDHSNVTLDAMGIPREQVDGLHFDPYPRSDDAKIAVCAGTKQIDMVALSHLANARPNWQLHILGRLKTHPPWHRNITWHGEQSFEQTLSFIAHADIGLAPYLDQPGIAYQTTNSNRMLLYRHFGLPIIGPDRLCDPNIPTIIGYSEPCALDRCESMTRRPEIIADWSYLAQSLVQNGVTDPPREVSIDPADASNPRVKTVPALASKA